MYTSTEVRWFLPGNVPDEIWRWVGSEGAPEQEPPRVDHYLRGSGETLGIKLRQGMVEVKQRRQPPEVTGFAPDVSGQMESWHKWSFQLTDEPAVLGLGIQGGGWIGVQKQRWLKAFRAAQQVERLQLAELASSGCIWEVSQLRVEGLDGAWWSLCYEAFGEQAEQREMLTRVIDHTLLLKPGVQFTAESSFGYPHWIAGLGE